MDRVDEYRDIIERILEAHHRIPYSHGQIESKLIIDRDSFPTGRCANGKLCATRRLRQR